MATNRLLFHLDYATEADAVFGLARWSCTARHFTSRYRRGISGGVEGGKVPEPAEVLLRSLGDPTRAPGASPVRNG